MGTPSARESCGNSALQYWGATNLPQVLAQYFWILPQVLRWRMTSLLPITPPINLIFLCSGENGTLEAGPAPWNHLGTRAVSPCHPLIYTPRGMKILKKPKVNPGNPESTKSTYNIAQVMFPLGKECHMPHMLIMWYNILLEPHMAPEQTKSRIIRLIPKLWIVEQPEQNCWLNSESYFHWPEVGMGETHGEVFLCWCFCLVGFCFLIQKKKIKPLVNRKSWMRGLWRAWLRSKTHTQTHSKTHGLWSRG